MKNKIAYYIGFILLGILIGTQLGCNETIQFKEIEKIVEIETKDSTEIQRLSGIIDSFENLKPKIKYVVHTEFKVIEKNIPLIIGKYRRDTVRIEDTVFIKTKNDYVLDHKGKYISYNGKISNDTLKLSISGKAKSFTSIEVKERPFINDKLIIKTTESDNPYIKVDNEIDFTKSFKKSQRKYGLGVFVGPGINFRGKPKITLGIGLVIKK